MQWKSFLYFLTAAECALAGVHGHHRRRNPRHLAPEAGLIARNNGDNNVATVVHVTTVTDIDVVTITMTVTAEESTTTSPIVADTTAPTTTAGTVEETTISDVVQKEEVVDTATTTTSDIQLTTLTTVSKSTTTTTTSSTSPTTTTTPTASSAASNWASIPSDDTFSTSGFGGRTNSSGSGISYVGNVGNPWGSNIIEVSASEAYQYQYVIQIKGSNTEAWSIVFWNKIGPDGKLDGWYGHSALKLTLDAGETKYVAFDKNSQGGWGAAEGDSLPTDDYGGYSCTWGEFDFGNTSNDGWSGWDVSAIQAQEANQTVQGMKICEHGGSKCSYITTGAAVVKNAYTAAEASIDGIGGITSADYVRLVVHVDYSG